MTQVSSELQSIVDNFIVAEQRLQEAITRVPPGAWSEQSPNVGWTFKDLLAHLATGDWLCQHLLRGLLETGSLPDWLDADAGNAESVAARRGKSVNKLAEERAQHREETIRLIARLQPEHLDSPIDMPWDNILGAQFRLYLQMFPGHDFGHTAELISTP